MRLYLMRSYFMPFVARLSNSSLGLTRRVMGRTVRGLVGQQFSTSSATRQGIRFFKFSLLRPVVTCNKNYKTLLDNLAAPSMSKYLQGCYRLTISFTQKSMEHCTGNTMVFRY